MSDQIIPRDKKLAQFKEAILSKKVQAAVANALPQHLNAEKMARVVITAVTRTPKLLECRPETVMNAVIEASQLGLMPDGVLGHGYLVPYKSTCVFIPGYKGLLDLARRSGEIEWVQAHVVYEGDDFAYQLGMDPQLHHIPARAAGREPGKMIAAYGVAQFKTGAHHFEVMWKDEIEDIRKRSRARDDGPWVTDYNEMARKTVIRRLCKFLPLNPEYQQLVARDEYHEAGVLEKYLDVDPATGEVTEAGPPSTGDMLDMFAEQLEGDKEDEAIEDPRFESVPDPEPEPEPEDEAGDEEKQPGGDGGDAAAADEEEGSDEPFKTDGSGRISREEDTSFIVAVANVVERMRKIEDEDEVQRIISRLCGGYGAEKPIEIRSRFERVEFYRDLVKKAEELEVFARPPMD
jgi:recombination protein RecT